MISSSWPFIATSQCCVAVLMTGPIQDATSTKWSVIIWNSKWHQPAMSIGPNYKSGNYKAQKAKARDSNRTIVFAAEAITKRDSLKLKDEDRAWREGLKREFGIFQTEFRPIVPKWSEMDGCSDSFGLLERLKVTTWWYWWSASDSKSEKGCQLNRG